MTRAAAVPFSGRTKWGDVVGSVVLATLGGISSVGETIGGWSS